MDKNIACIILAAGRGERMKSRIPKVLHPVCGRPMIGFVLDLVHDLRIKRVITVLGHGHNEVRKLIKPGIKVAIQKRLKGTADAVREALPLLKGVRGTVLVLYGDIPLLKKETISRLLKHHIDNKLDATLLTVKLEKPSGYGRILRDKYSSICGIVEEKDADDFQKDIKEINTGIICFDKNKLAAALKQVRPNNRKKEYYLTDTIAVLYKNGGLIEDIKTPDINETLGVNSRSDLACANAIMQKRINEHFMKQGVSIVDPDTTFINFGAKIGPETTIYPFTVIERGVKIGNRCFIGPFAHLRGGTELGNDVTAGNFLETVRSKIGHKVLAKHFCYIGDSRLGEGVNIGAGVVTANFNGTKKNNTIIEKGSFIGSDTVLVAPVKIGRQALTAAGSVVIKNVKAKTKVAGVPAKELKPKR